MHRGQSTIGVATKRRQGPTEGSLHGQLGLGLGLGLGREQLKNNSPEQMQKGTHQHDSARRQISACEQGCTNLRPRQSSHTLTSVNQRLTPINVCFTT